MRGLAVEEISDNIIVDEDGEPFANTLLLQVQQE